ncbi:MAG: EamA family transporter [Gammaproteobacteria bacterium]|nr:MAG: EamA family transporter [Gammaproteobacteria bacterium]
MNTKVLVYILVSVSMSAIAQITLKVGMSSEKMKHALSGAVGRFDALWFMVTDFFVITGLSIYFIGALVWLLVLAKIDVSVAYPFVGLGFILTMAAGALFLGEPLGMQRMIGTFLVVAGVTLVAQT